MFTLEIHAEYNAATLQKKMHSKIYNSTITLGTPYLDPPEHLLHPRMLPTP